VLDRLQSGQIQAVDQTTQGVSYAAKLRSTDAHIDWSDSAAEIHNLIRGCTPAPGAWTQYRDLRIKISRSRLANHVTDLGPGAVAIRDGLFMVGTGTHALHLETLQPAGKTQMPATSWLNGQHEQVQFT
jgi:methionyl-tRNA formyltransferase